MVSLKKRLLREKQRLHKIIVRLLWRFYGFDAPVVFLAHDVLPGSAIERLLFYLLNNGWHAMSEQELLKGKWPKKSFYLTFDDIPDSVYINAFPILKQLHVPFTVFIAADLVNKEGYITTAHLQELINSPLCSVGCHGLKHVSFRGIASETLYSQTLDARSWLENQFKAVVSTFAYPYGGIVEVSGDNRRVIHQLGYRMAFSTFEGTLRSQWYTSLFFLPRVNVSERFVDKFISGKFPNFKDCEGR